MPEGSTASGRPSAGRLLYLVTEDWYFCMHWLPVARAARDAGYEVGVVTHVQEHSERLEREGFRVIPFDLARGNRNPLAEIVTIGRLSALYRRERPDIVHHIAMKPTVQGALAARLAGVPAVVNLLAGLGFVFTARGGLAWLRRSMIGTLLRLLLGLGNSRTLLLNPDDRALLTDRGILQPRQIVQLLGSGIELDRFQPLAPPRNEVPVAAIAARMIAIKGVDVAVAAMDLLRRRGVALELRLFGIPDETNPSSYTASQLADWGAEPNVEWRGFVEDPRDIWVDSDIALLPSRGGEGLPVSLMEAAACARPVVTTRTPGCREIVREGENGYLVPADDPEALAAALETLAADSDLRRRMGQASRALVEGDMSAEAVAGRVLSLYRELGRKNADGQVPAV